MPQQRSDFLKNNTLSAAKELILELFGNRHVPFIYEKRDGEIVITGYKDSLLPKINIPGELHGKPVTKIDTRAFHGCKFLEEVHVSDGVKIIAPNAFSACERLSKVYIAGSVDKIGRNVFFECENLFCAELESGIREIESRAFFGCTGLRDINLPDSIESIGDQAFYGCKKLKSIHIPLSLTALPRNAFDECISLDAIFVERGSPADRILSDSEHYAKKLRYIPRI